MFGWHMTGDGTYHRLAAGTGRLASVSSTKSLLKSGYARTGAEMSLLFNVSKAAWHSELQTKGDILTRKTMQRMGYLGKLRDKSPVV